MRKASYQKVKTFFPAMDKAENYKEIDNYEYEYPIMDDKLQPGRKYVVEMLRI